jgi:hypothetical protein
MSTIRNRGRERLLHVSRAILRSASQDSHWEQAATAGWTQLGKCPYGLGQGTGEAALDELGSASGAIALFWRKVLRPLATHPSPCRMSARSPGRRRASVAAPLMPQRRGVRLPWERPQAGSAAQPSGLFGPSQRSISRPAASSTVATYRCLCASIPIVIIVKSYLSPRGGWWSAAPAWTGLQGA